MDHGGEAARPTMAGSTELGIAGAVRGSEASFGSGAFDGHLGAAAVPPGSFSLFDPVAVAGRGVVPVVLVGPQFHIHHEPGPGGLAYPNDIGAASWRQLGPVGVVLVHPQLPGGVVAVPYGNYGYYSALPPRPGLAARRGVLLGDQLPGGGGAVYNWDYVLQRHPGAAHGELLLDPLPDGAGYGEAFVGLLPAGVDAGYHNYAYYTLLPRSDDRHGVVLVGQLPDGAGHGEAFVRMLPGGIDAAYDNYAYYALQPRPGVGRGEMFIGPLPDVVSQTLSADEIAGALRDPNLSAGYDGSAALADDDLSAGYNSRGMAAEHLRRLLPFAGIGASVAINGLAAGPGSPTVAFQLFVLLLGGLFLVTLHVLHL